jgi:membrane-bound lytic murein transglycosylase F
MKQLFYNKYFLILVASLLIFSLGYLSNRKNTTPTPEGIKLNSSIIRDLDSIKTRGKLTVLTRYNSNSFFLYKGQTMGFEYELLKLFAEDLGVNLEMKIAPSWDSLFIMLQNGDGDLIAANLAVTRERAEKVAFSEHHSTTRQVLIQRIPFGAKKLKQHEIEKRMVRTPIDLIGEVVTVRENSPYEKRLKNLSEEMGGEIIIEQANSSMETERLIELVEDGVIKYTVADENTARVHTAFYKHIDTKTPVSFPQRIAWALRKNSPELKESVDSWLKRLKSGKNPTFNVIYNKYHNSKRQFKKRRESDFFALHTGMISPYDSLFKEYESELFPWTLLASLAFQESTFDKRKKSWAGAIGLMQLLPTTADLVKVSDIENPENSIIAGTKYLNFIYKKFWSDLPDSEAIKFTLASYNAGAGHIRDAQRLAEALGDDPQKWTGSVDYALLKLSKKKFYYRPEVQHGYCRGQEPYDYVEEILRRRKIYDDVLSDLKNRNNILRLKTPEHLKRYGSRYKSTPLQSVKLKSHSAKIGLRVWDSSANVDNK